MQLRNLIDDDDAVSPVIGVILMVAITVILAAVIATFVLGLGEQVSETAPQASFTFDYSEDMSGSPDSSFESDCSSYDGILTITHAGGATMNANQIGVRGTSGTAGAWSDSSNSPSYGSGSEIAAGDDINVCVAASDSVLITWTSQGGQDSATLRRWNGPGA